VIVIPLLFDIVGQIPVGDQILERKNKQENLTGPLGSKLF